MMDKSHCFMNAADEHEYALFYDFAKLFPLAQRQPAPDEENKAFQNVEVGDASADGSKLQGLVSNSEKSVDVSGAKTYEDAWEDIDIEDANDDELSLKNHQAKLQSLMSTPQKSRTGGNEEQEEEFSIISDDKQSSS
jgi:hypothetical protein